MKQVDPVAAGIRDIINERGFKQKAIATRAGFSIQQFSAMLNGLKILRAYDLFNISAALGVSIEEIYKAGEKYRDKSAAASNTN